MIKNYNSLIWRLKTQLNNRQEIVMGENPTQSVRAKKSLLLKTFLLSLLFMSGTFSFAQTYCTPVYTYGCSNGATIASVTTSSAVTNLSNLSTGCTSITAMAYNNYSATMQMAASQGTQFSISVGITNYSAGVKVWIDYNQNGTFEATELVSESTSTIASGSTYTGTISIPLTSTLGITRMRVRAVESYTVFDPCDSQYYGETEDYAINIITPPSCLPPSALVISALTTTTATMSWTASGTNPTNGYDIYYSTTSTAPTAATVPTVNNHTASPYLANGLTNATTYYWWVRADCGTEESLWSYGGSFYTSYCIPVGSPSYYLNNVVTTGGVTNFANPTGGSPLGYGNYSATISVSNFIGQTTTISLTASTTSNIYSCWIDWNNDLDFNDVGETIFVSSYGANYTGTITIPSGTALGNYRMRVSTSYIGTVPACGPATYGEYEDYTFSVVAQPTCVSPSALAFSALTNATVTLSWTASVTPPTNGYDIYYSTTNTAPTAATVPTVNNHPASPYLATGLSTSTTYYWWVRSDCSVSDQSAWALGGSFTTTQIPAVVPFTDDFSTTQWTPLNGTQANKWFIGAAAGNPANGLYISNDNGVTNAYTDVLSVTQAYRDITFPVTANPFSLSFDWKAYAESCCDYLRVWMVPSTATITPGVQISTANTPGAVQLGANFNQQQAWNTANFVLPSATYSGTTKRLVFEWRNDGSVNYLPPAAIDNVMMTVISCPAPTAVAATAITTTTANLSWTENGSSTDWEIQYGTGSFVPNTGPSIATSSNPYSFTSLQPSTTYRVYVRSRCSPTDSSLWVGPYILITNCAPITALPWAEDFENIITVGANAYPPCWLNENPGVWESTSATASTLTSGPLSGTKNLRVRYGSNATMWTPEFDLVAGETYEFSFNWGGDSYNAWDGGVYVNSTQSFASATLLGAKFVEVGDPTTLAYRPEIYCFTPTTSGVYTFGIKVIETGFNWYMSFDDFGLRQIVTVPGIDGSFTACLTGSPVDLNTVITTASTDGSWNFGLNPNAVDTAGLFNTASVPAGVHEFLYITAGCAPDTTIATITVVKPSSAGSDGSLAVCRNQPFNLLQGLNGLVDLGGVWTNPNAQVVPNGNTTSSNLPGQYNFQYIVSNGVCPADTANVVVNVLGTCDYLGLEDLAFEAFNMYPNPSSDIVFITNSGSTEVFNYEVLDMNGRVILKANNAINGSTTTELDLRQVEIGVYLIRVFNENADKTFRVVKN